MATISPFHRYYLHFYPLLLFFLTLTLIPKPIFSSPPNLISISNPNITLLGDANFDNADSFIKLTLQSHSSCGLIIYKNPFKFLQQNPRNPISFSTDFSFSGNKHPFVFFIAPADFASNFTGKCYSELSRELGMREKALLGIAFHDSHVEIEFGNVSIVDLGIDSGEKLHTWINYEASSKRIEIRLSELGNEKPYNPVLSYPIDLSKMWKNEDVFVGIGSRSEFLENVSDLYSWRFGLRSVPTWMHSQPLNPWFHKGDIEEERAARRRRVCASIVVIGGCALVASAVMFLVVVFVKRRAMPTCEYPVLGLNFKYEKVNDVGEKNADCVKC